MVIRWQEILLKLVIHFFADDSYLFFRANIVECQIISQCLEEYAIASRQSINLFKSFLMFSKNVKASLQEEISLLIDIPVVPHQG